MGYWLDGEIVITGRAKDLILHNGRNIWPQDIEWAAEQIEPLRSGDAAAFAVEGDDGEDKVVVLVAVPRWRAREMEAAAAPRSPAVVRRLPASSATFVLVPPQSLPFTSSGKLSRAGRQGRAISPARSRRCRRAWPARPGSRHARSRRASSAPTAPNRGASRLAVARRQGCRA